MLAVWALLVVARAALPLSADSMVDVARLPVLSLVALFLRIMYFARVERVPFAVRLQCDHHGSQGQGQSAPGKIAVSDS